MKTLFHVDRDYDTPLNRQLAELKKLHAGFEYLYTYGRKVHFMAENPEKPVETRLMELMQSMDFGDAGMQEAAEQQRNGGTPNWEVLAYGYQAIAKQLVEIINEMGGAKQ